MSDRDLERLTAELRRWAGRPSCLSPRAARTRVLAHLPSVRRHPDWRLATGGALAAAALVMALLVGQRTAPVPEPRPVTAEIDQQTIVHQLSSGTKLYIVVRPDAGGGENDC